MESKELRENGLVFYVYDDVEVVLANLDNSKFENVKCLADDGNLGAFPIKDIDFELTKQDIRQEYSASYCCDCDDFGAEIVLADVMNVENEQKLVYTFVDKEYAEDDQYQRELMTQTNGYYDWESERTKFINRCANDTTITAAQAMDEWHKITANYKNHFGDEAAFTPVWDIVKEYRNNISE